MSRLKFLSLVNSLKNDPFDSEAYQEAVLYEPIVLLILAVIKNNPKFFANIDLSDATLEDMIELIDLFFLSQRKRSYRSDLILGSCLKNSEKFTTSELFILFVLLLGPKIINIRITRRQTKNGLLTIALSEISEEIALQSSQSNLDFSSKGKAKIIDCLVKNDFSRINLATAKHHKLKK